MHNDLGQIKLRLNQNPAHLTHVQNHDQIKASTMIWKVVSCQVKFHGVQHNKVKSCSWTWSGPWSILRLGTPIFPASGNWSENVNVCRVSSPKSPRALLLVIKFHQTTTQSALSQYLTVHDSALAWQISNLTNIYIHSALSNVSTFTCLIQSSQPFLNTEHPPSILWKYSALLAKWVFTPSDQASPLSASSAETNVQ